jgi:hypothetical protein
MQVNLQKLLISCQNLIGNIIVNTNLLHFTLSSTPFFCHSLLSLTMVALRFNYVEPTMTLDDTLVIVQGR